MSEGRAWTQDDVAKLVAMLRDGRTTEEAANALGRTVPAIWQYMRYHRQAFQGLPERRGGARGRAAMMGGGAYMRRITGYLVGTLDRFNDAKRAEEADRVKHGMGGKVK